MFPPPPLGPPGPPRPLPLAAETTIKIVIHSILHGKFPKYKQMNEVVYYSHLKNLRYPTQIFTSLQLGLNIHCNVKRNNVTVINTYAIDFMICENISK